MDPLEEEEVLPKWFSCLPDRLHPYRFTTANMDLASIASAVLSFEQTPEWFERGHDPVALGYLALGIFSTLAAGYIALQGSKDVHYDPSTIYKV